GQGAGSGAGGGVFQGQGCRGLRPSAMVTAPADCSTPTIAALTSPVRGQGRMFPYRPTVGVCRLLQKSDENGASSNHEFGGASVVAARSTWSGGFDALIPTRVTQLQRH